MRDDDPGGPPTVLLSNRQAVPVDEDALRALAQAALEGEGLRECELSVSFVDEKEMSDLHATYMHEPGPTDVLSFPIDDTGPDGTRVLGDVVIAPAVAAAQNPTDVAGEMRLLLVHGILHLLGYDHEEETGRAAMWSRQERYSGVVSP
jgi:probable rRNA maturation factor